MLNLIFSTILAMVIFLTCRLIWKQYLNQERDINLIKKATVFDLQPQFFGIGIILSMSLVYFALDYTREEAQDLSVDWSGLLDDEAIMQIPRTAEIRKAPPPPPTIIEEIEVFEEEDEEVIFIDESIEEIHYEQVNVQKPLPKAPPVLPMEEEEDIPEIRTFAEQMPRFPGCDSEQNEESYRRCTDQNLMSFLAKHLRYPQIAQENGIEGMCVVQFIIDSDGHLLDCKLARDIGGGCGQEALRVMKLLVEKTGKWTPGKQGGRPVKVQYSLPVKFNLK